MSISGAGLSSCNATTSKLVYNSTTKLFECSIDNTASSGTVNLLGVTASSVSASTTNFVTTSTNNLMSSDATITNATSTNLNSSNIVSVNISTTNSTLTNATTTNSFATTASSTNLFSQLANFGSLLSQSIFSSLADLTTLNASTTNASTTNTLSLLAGNSTTTNATTTNFFAATASATALTALNASFTNFSAALQNGYIWRGDSNNINQATNTLFIADNGYIGYGTTTPSNPLLIYSSTTPTTPSGLSEMLRVVADGFSSSLLLESYRTSGNHSKIQAIASRGTLSTPTQLLSGDTVFELQGFAKDELSVNRQISRITFGADETTTSTTSAGNINFRVTKSGTVADAAVMTIKNSGFVGIGSTAPPGKLYISGDITDSSWTTAGKVIGTNNLTLTDNSTLAGSTIATRVSNGLGRPTFDFTNATSTITNASSLYLTGAPLAAASSTLITNSIALQIAGPSVGTGVTNSYGMYVAAPTGATNNYSGVFTSGNFGIGTTSPGSLLSVSGAGTTNTFAITNTGTGNTMYLEDAANDSTPIVVSASGNLGIGTSTPGSLLSVAGNSYFSGNLLASGYYDSVASTGGYRIDGVQFLNASATLQFVNIGTANTGESFRGASVGYANTNNAVESYVFGRGNTTSGLGNAFVLGRSNSVSGNYANAFGFGNIASSLRSTAVGYNTSATADDASAFGRDSIASGIRSTALGYVSTASGTDSVAIGRGSIASGADSLSIGRNSRGSGDQSTAVGYLSEAQGLHSSSIGSGNIAAGQSSSALGRNNVASGTLSTAVGYTNYSPGDFSSAIGYFNNASGSRASAYGYNNTVLAGDSAAFGHNLTNGNASTTIYGRSINTTSGYWNTNQLSLGMVAIGVANGGLAIDTSGNVAIGTTTPTAQFTTTGSVRLAGLGSAGANLTTDALGNVTASSDEKLKDKQSDFTRGLEDIMKISPVNYKWNATSGLDTENTYTGFFAQNVLEAIPEAVATDTRGFLTLSDRPILATIINSIKEIAKKLSSLADEVLTNKVRTKVLCVGDTCVDEEQFARILNGQVANSVIQTVQTQAPTWTEGIIITLNGQEQESVSSTTTTYVDMGATAVYTNNLGETSSVEVNSDSATSVIVGIPGQYTVTYTAGNGTATSTKVRTIIVE